MTSRNKKPLRYTPDRQSPASIGGFGLGFTGYFVAEFALAGRPHLLHWIATAIAALVGLAGGWVWPTFQEWRLVRSAKLRRGHSKPY
jgi:hypothetical protein